jgi:YegS/Rv2252/BmrU family lipid kinase
MSTVSAQEGAFVFIVNPRSANGATLRRFERVRDRFAQELGKIDVKLTERPRHATGIAREAVQSRAKAVIAVGGDGTNNEVINGFFDDEGRSINDAKSPTAFGVITSGTGGDFRRTFGWTTDPLDDLARFKRFQTKDIDVGKVTFAVDGGKTQTKVFLNSSGFGASGDIVDVVNKTTKAFGAQVSFYAGTVRALLSFSPKRVSISYDDGPAKEGEVTVVSVSNGQYFGGGMRIAPAAAVDDGQFDVVVVTGGALGLFVRHGLKLYSGTHTSLPEVTITRARKVTAAPKNPQERVLIETDGEQPGFLPATFEVVPAVLPLLV